MGGRSEKKQPEFQAREAWIEEVSDKRLDRYARMLDGENAGRRLNGEARPDGGEYFADIIEREQKRRAGEFDSRWNQKGVWRGSS